MIADDAQSASASSSSGAQQEHAVPEAAVQDYASRVGASVFVTSARTGYGVQVRLCFLFIPVVDGVKISLLLSNHRSFTDVCAVWHR